jgi:hypothetical protein
VGAKEGKPYEAVDKRRTRKIATISTFEALILMGNQQQEVIYKNTQKKGGESRTTCFEPKFIYV